MENFHDLLMRRRSIRKYTEEEISAEDVKLILEAALVAPTSKNSRPWYFVTVEDKRMLEELAKCKEFGAGSIAKCSLAIAVVVDPMKSEAWVEDASVAATFIQLQAEALGLGSCWVQVRGRMRNDEESADDYVKALLNIPADMVVECIISLGQKGEERKPFNPEKMLWERVHIGEWRPQE